MKEYIKEGLIAIFILILFTSLLDFIPFIPKKFTILLIGGTILVMIPLYFLTPSSWYSNSFTDVVILIPLLILSFIIYSFLIGTLSYNLNKYLFKKINYNPKFKKLITIMLILFLSILFGLISYTFLRDFTISQL